MKEKFLELMKERRSERKFLNIPIPKNQIEKIIDCASFAATARNIQPWEFIVITDTTTKKLIADLAPNGSFLANAPSCIAVFCQDTKYYLEDGCAATENILLAATCLGIASCWVAGDKKPYCQKIRSLLSLPENYKLISIIALGYSEEKAACPPKRQLNAVLHWEKYQKNI